MCIRDRNRRYAVDGKKKAGRNIRTPLGVEKPKGQWNEIEIRVNGSEKATFILNGEVVLETFDFYFTDESGNKVPLDKGHIGLQAEWAELMYRNIRIKDLSPVETSPVETSPVEDGSGAKASDESDSKTSDGSDSK